MLELGGLKAGEKMYDLGSGDGRIVIMAAQKFHAEAVGVEIDSKICGSRASIAFASSVSKRPPTLCKAICCSRITVRPIW